MATGTVKESEEKRKREETLAEARRELREAMARYARAELACCGAGSRHESLLDRRLRAERWSWLGRVLSWRTGRTTRRPAGVRTAAAGRGCCGSRSRVRQAIWRCAATTARVGPL